MSQRRTWTVFCLASVCAVALTLGACNLNPTPEDPGIDGTSGEPDFSEQLGMDAVPPGAATTPSATATIGAGSPEADDSDGSLVIDETPGAGLPANNGGAPTGNPSPVDTGPVATSPVPDVPAPGQEMGAQEPMSEPEAPPGDAMPEVPALPEAPVDTDAGVESTDAGDAGVPFEPGADEFDSGTDGGSPR